MFRVKDITIAVLFIAVMYLVATRHWDKDPTKNAYTSGPAIAVLPFVITSSRNDVADSQVAEFNEELIEELGRFPDLTISVASGDSVMEGTSLDAHPGVSRLGVTHILEGGVKLTDDRVRVSAQLIDKDVHKWSRSYDRSSADLRLLPSEIARAVALQVDRHRGLLDDQQPVLGLRVHARQFALEPGPTVADTGGQLVDA